MPEAPPKKQLCAQNLHGNSCLPDVMYIWNMKKLFLTICLFFFTGVAFAQENPYMFPVRPGQQNYLSGTMGEMRGSHFHGGIDIKTGGVTGKNIYAAADGYISRIKVDGGGYGNARRHCNRRAPDEAQWPCRCRGWSP